MDSVFMGFEDEEHRNEALSSAYYQWDSLLINLDQPG